MSHARPVGRQAFFLGQQANVVGDRFQPRLGERDHASGRRKSLADSPLANRAVPPVGSTCDGPAT